MEYIQNTLGNLLEQTAFYNLEVGNYDFSSVPISLSCNSKRL